MLVYKVDYKKLIFKLVIAIVLLLASGVMVYKNFITEEQKFYFPDAENLDGKSLYNKFNLDFFEDELFKSLVQPKDFTTSSIGAIGRDNPFMEVK